MTKIGLVVNPTSGHGRGRPAGVEAHRLLVARGLDVVDLTAPTLAQATDAARRAVLRDLDALVVVGGDGMAHLGANVTATTSCPLGIIAAGSGNDIAAVLGLPLHDVPAAVDAVLHGISNGARPIDAVHVRPPHQAAGEWYVGVLSVGIDAATNARANRYRFPPGTARYLRAVAVEVLRHRPYGYRVTVDGEKFEVAGPLFAVANVSTFGGGMRIAPGAVIDDGRLDLVYAEALTRLQVVSLVPKLYSGAHLKHPSVRVGSGAQVLVEASQVGAPPPVAYADGERIGPLPLLATVVPGALQILV
jgi:diacylglycerol kinase (ATP)